MSFDDFIEKLKTANDVIPYVEDVIDCKETLNELTETTISPIRIPMSIIEKIYIHKELPQPPLNYNKLISPDNIKIIGTDIRLTKFRKDRRIIPLHSIIARKKKRINGKFIAMKNQTSYHEILLMQMPDMEQITVRKNYNIFEKITIDVELNEYIKNGIVHGLFLKTCKVTRQCENCGIIKRKKTTKELDEINKKMKYQIFYEYECDNKKIIITVGMYFL